MDKRLLDKLLADLVREVWGLEVVNGNVTFSLHDRKVDKVRLEFIEKL